MSDAECQCDVIEDGQVLLVTLNHGPDNTVTPSLLESLAEAVDRVAEESELRMGIIRGHERVFSKGYSLDVIRRFSDRESHREELLLGNDVMSSLSESRKPWIAAINGACLGAGLELALACHFRLSSDRARLGLPELSVGLLPGLGGIQRLTKLIGRARALEMIVAGVLVPSDQALQWGLVHRVIPKDQFWDGVLSFARGLSGLDSHLVSESLRLTAVAESHGAQECVLETVDSILRLSGLK